VRTPTERLAQALIDEIHYGADVRSAKTFADAALGKHYTIEQMCPDCRRDFVAFVHRALEVAELEALIHDSPEEGDDA
jgi:hypothetical protein